MYIFSGNYYPTYVNQAYIQQNVAPTTTTSGQVVYQYINGGYQQLTAGVPATGPTYYNVNGQYIPTYKWPTVTSQQVREGDTTYRRLYIKYIGQVISLGHLCYYIQ